MPVDKAIYLKAFGEILNKSITDKKVKNTRETFRKVEQNIFTILGYGWFFFKRKWDLEITKEKTGDFDYLPILQGKNMNKHTLKNITFFMYVCTHLFIYLFIYLYMYIYLYLDIYLSIILYLRVLKKIKNKGLIIINKELQFSDKGKEWWLTE